MYSKKIKLHEREKRRGPGSLRTIVLDVTPKCNMSCSHCYAANLFHVTPVDLGVLENLFKQTYEMGVTHYVLMGGEPIMDLERVKFICEKCHPDEAFITVTTNGWEMDREKIRLLKSWGVDKISVSLDSGIESEHDASRRQGSFKRVKEMVDLVLDEGLITALDVLVTHQSLHSEGFKKAYDFAVEKGIRFDLQIAEPVGKWDGNREVLITPEDASYIKKLRETGPRTKAGEPTIKRDIFSGSCDHCPAGTDFLHISADGNVFPCNFLQFTLGNIKEKSLKQMRDDLLTHPLFSSVDHPKCLCGEDDSFIEQFIMPYVKEKKPLDAYKVFNLKHQGASK